MESSFERQTSARGDSSGMLSDEEEDLLAAFVFRTKTLEQWCRLVMPS